MEKQRGIRTLSIVALFVAVIGLSVAFAAMSRTLQINGTATMDTAKWDIHFKDLTPVVKTGAAVEETAPTINTEDTVIGDYKVTYKVTDSDNNETTLTIKVSVKAKGLPSTGGQNSFVILAMALGLVAAGALVIKSKRKEA